MLLGLLRRKLVVKGILVKWKNKFVLFLIAFPTRSIYEEDSFGKKIWWDNIHSTLSDKKRPVQRELLPNKNAIKVKLHTASLS